MFYEIEKESKHRFYPNDFCDIVLKINKVEPLKMIWDILNEYGHHQSGPPVKTEDEYKLEREVLAWKFADEHLKLYPELEKHKDDYAKYRWYCLGSYGVYKS